MRRFLDEVQAVCRSYPSAAPAGQPYRKPRELIHFPSVLRCALTEGWADDFRRSDEQARERRRVELERAAEQRQRRAELPTVPPINVLEVVENVPPWRPPQAAPPSEPPKRPPVDVLAAVESRPEWRPGRRPAAAGRAPSRPPMAAPDAGEVWRAFAESLGLPPKTLELWFFPFRPQLSNSSLVLYCDDEEVIQTFTDCYLPTVRQRNPDLTVSVVFDG